MGQARRKFFSEIAIFTRMKASDVYDFVLMSVIDTLLNELLIRCGTHYRESRINSMQELLMLVQKSYEGYIPENYIARSEKFLSYLHSDMNSLIKDIKTLKG